MSHTVFGGSLCVHSDVISHMAPRAQQEVQGILGRLGPGSTPQDVAAAYAESLRWLKSHAEEAFPLTMEVECLAHRR
eukprot:12127332-Alexandrium_andersonii.AAC.1